MTGLLSDLRHAFRLSAATPFSSLLAVVVLAFALAFVTALFSLWNDLALAPHPGVADSRQIVTIMQDTGEDFRGLPVELLEAMNDDLSSVDQVAGTTTTNRDVVIDGESLRAGIEQVSREYFPVMRPLMHLGRPLRESDHHADAEPAVVLSYAFWMRHFDGDREVLGHEFPIHGPPVMIRTGGETTDLSETTHGVRVVGVMAPAMRSTTGGGDTDLWLAYEPDRALVDEMMPSAGMVIDSMTAMAQVPGRAAPAALEDELNQRFADAGESIRGLRSDARLVVSPGIVHDPAVQKETSRQVALFMVGSILVLLVAAASTSLFMLSRAPARQRELGIRQTVGATRWRLARQLIGEAALIVMVAAVLALVLGLWLAVLLKDMAFLQDARWRDVHPLDWRVLAAMATASMVLTAVVSLAPVWSLGRLSIVASTRQVSARPRPSQRLAGLVQIALSGLLGGAALAFAWHMILLERADIGFDPSDVVIVMPEIERQDMLRAQWDEVVALRSSRREVLESLPSVEAVGFAHPVPTVAHMSMSMSAPLADDPEESLPFTMASIDTRYPHIMGKRLLAGNWPADDDPTAVLVNETFARGMWGHTDVVDEVIELRGPTVQDVEGNPRVVSVLANTVHGHPSEAVGAMVYSQVQSNSLLDVMVLQTRRSPSELRSMLEEKVSTGELDFELDWIERLSSRWHEELAADRARPHLTLGSAVLVMMLAGLGFFGTQRYLVSAGRREYAIHAAVGATPTHLALLDMKRGLQLGLPGLAIGTLLAYIVTLELRETFVDPSISPLLVSMLTGLALLVLVILSCAGPARKISRLQPSNLLRDD
ncbi:ABC transporter permease [Wenzhouxiangella sp. AB-CW3]|uniref:FtsX-like permease family protein n=1 Tax=Wenzhouxiangella sp. AB-CW3 TaxID=2771012 RepID=UPI00168B2E72|nr:FtsX-like permease family protein [Wenzhouxiangella sp. AB-CW3]QOC22279.1 ABC transporter permease [Wenzhouxiangella sp. AB-CW3]